MRDEFVSRVSPRGKATTGARGDQYCLCCGIGDGGQSYNDRRRLKKDWTGINPSQLVAGKSSGAF